MTKTLFRGKVSFNFVSQKKLLLTAFEKGNYRAKDFCIKTPMLLTKI
jgi:hypothetical protein